MLRFSRCLFTLLLFSCFTLHAQESYQALEWGVIHPDDLAMTSYALDTAAQAVVLADEGYATIDYSESWRYEYTLRRHRQVKILHEAAIQDYGDVSIYFYHKDNQDELRKIKAQTIAPDGTVTQVNGNDIYFEELNAYWSKATFSFNNVTVGSVLEYRYLHNSHRIMVPDEWTFREEIPVRSSYYKFKCVVPLVYNYVLRGSEYMTSETTDENKKVLRLGDTEIYVDGPSIWMKNGAAVHEEPFMTTVEDYYIKVHFQASEVVSLTGQTHSFYSTWQEAANDLLDLDDLGGAFSKKRYYRKLLGAAQAAISPDVKGAELVYQISQFVTQQIKWSGRRGIRTDITIDEAFARHEADLPEIQYAGLALLREFGIQADPIILSTRDNGAMIQEFPFLDQFNYVVLLIEVEGRKQLLDLSDPQLKPGIIQVQALNSYGFLLTREAPQWINLGLPIMQDVLVWRGQIHADGMLEGEMTYMVSAFNAQMERLAIAEDRFSERWINRMPEGSTLSELNANQADDIRKVLKIKSQFTVPDAGFANDDFLYVTPTIYMNFHQNPFTLDKRDYPIDFPYPFEEKSIYNYEIPEGYSIESLPEDVYESLPNGDAIFSYKCQERDQKINIVIQFRVQKTLFSPTEYTTLKNLFETLEDKLQEQLVLRKTDTSN